MAQRYETYKKCGVQWIGEIPSHWGCVPFRRIATVKSNLVHPNDYLDFPQVSPDCIEKNSGRLISWKTVAESNIESDNHRFYKGQIIYSKIRPLLNKVIIAPFDGLCSADMYPIETINDTKYMQYYMLSHLFLSEVRNVTRDRVKMPKINREELGQISIIVPSLAEQRAIVSYLDDKCSKIEEWLDKKQKEVEHLQELKQRIIADAVTRGLNPSAKMKTTDIPWLPQIPTHWEMSKVSSHFRQRCEKVSDKDYPPLSVSKQGVTPQLANVALSNAEGNARKLVMKGDYAVNSRSDRKGSCGVSKYEGSVSLITIVLEPFNINGEYIHYLFRSNPWVEEFYRNGRGIVADLWTTNYQMMKSMYLPVPPISEQREIVAYLDHKIAKIDTLTAKLQQEIATIKEYKQRLISDVVTGQIKVC